jgi:excisionase family DNA binding protein
VTTLDALGVRAEVEQLVDERIAQAFRRREPAKRWLSVAEAAAYLGITETALRARVKRGRVPVKHHGRGVVVDRVALDREIEDAA